VTWTEFLPSQAAVACDFFTVDAVTRRRYYLLFWIRIDTRQVSLGGVTANPTGAWTVQAARNLFLRHADQLTDSRALVRDRAGQFTAAFDQVFRSEDLKILLTPVRVPVAKAFAERWIGSIRRELLDRTLIWNRRQLEGLVTDYITHYNEHRPHRSLDQQPPHRRPSTPASARRPAHRTSTRCDGTHPRVPTRRRTSDDRILGSHRPS